MQYANYKVHTKFTSTRLSDPLCHSVKRGLTDWREIRRKYVYCMSNEGLEIMSVYGWG